MERRNDGTMCKNRYCVFYGHCDGSSGCNGYTTKTPSDTIYSTNTMCMQNNSNNESDDEEMIDMINCQPIITTTSSKKTVVFDFDGVIHSYTSGWKGFDNIPDPPVKGIRNALKEIREAGYEIAVVSTRCENPDGKAALINYLIEHDLYEFVDKVCTEKPPAICYIDDRAICFDGHPESLLSKIDNFKPWYK